MEPSNASSIRQPPGTVRRSDQRSARRDRGDPAGVRQWPLRVLEATFWVVGVVLLSASSAALIGGEVARKHAIAEFAHARAAYSTPATRETASASGIDAAPEASPTLDRADPASADSSPGPIALLSIPRVAFEVPVFADASEHNLNRGAGWITGTAAPGEDGNVGIAGHRDRYFRILKDVVVGDLVELESLSQRRTYRVTRLSIVKPGDNSSLRPTDDAVITLVTCYPFYFVGHAPKRYVVRAVDVSETAQTGNGSAPTAR